MTLIIVCYIAIVGCIIFLCANAEKQEKEKIDRLAKQIAKEMKEQQ